MSDQHEDPPPESDAACIDRARQDGEAGPLVPGRTEDSEPAVIVEVETPSEVLVKAVLEFSNDFETPENVSSSESSEWIEDETPSSHGIFGPLIILCLD